MVVLVLGCLCAYVRRLEVDPGVVVRDHEAIKLPLLAQHVIQELVMSASWFAVDGIVCE